jgi:phosphonoacetaldehyde hydrolase
MEYSFARRYIGPVKLVVVDLAGTVADYGSRAPAGAFVELFKRNGVEVSDAQARGPMGMEKQDHIRTMTQIPDIADKWRAAHDGRDCTEADVEAMYKEFIPLQVNALPAYCDLIPGTIEAMAELRGRGIRIAATTGYNTDMMNVVLECMKKQGFEPETAVCASDVPAGRPAPWMILECMSRLGVYPAESVVNIGDTIPDIAAGLNAGVWSVGVTRTGNMLGLSLGEADALDGAARKARLEKAGAVMAQAGAHFVAEGIERCPRIVELIDSMLAQGARP